MCVMQFWKSLNVCGQHCKLSRMLNRSKAGRCRLYQGLVPLLKDTTYRSRSIRRLDELEAAVQLSEVYAGVVWWYGTAVPPAEFISHEHGGQFCLATS
jgi:hypothetical protein